MSQPVRRRMFEAADLHLLRTDNSAGLAGHVKRRPQSLGTYGIHGVRLRGVNLHSARSSALSGRREAATSVSWYGASGQRPIKWVFEEGFPLESLVKLIEFRLSHGRSGCVVRSTSGQTSMSVTSFRMARPTLCLCHAARINYNVFGSNWHVLGVQEIVIQIPLI